MKPLVSLCIPTFNGAAYIRASLESALAQSFTETEIVVVDNASRDDTVAIVEDYARKDERIRVHINKKNLGLVGNLNRSVQLASGEWIKFVFQDDWLAPHCLSRMLAAARSDVDLVVGRRELVFSEDTPDCVKASYQRYVSEYDLARYFPDQSYISAREFVKLVMFSPIHNAIGEPTAALVRKSAFQRYGKFNSFLVSLCDWEFFARAAVNTGLCYVDDTLAFFRVHENSSSAYQRTQNAYQIFTLDELIVRHQIAYSIHFAPVRALSRQMRPSFQFRRDLADAVRRARWEAWRSPDPRKTRAQFRRTLRKFPRMLLFPPDYLWRMALNKIGIGPLPLKNTKARHV